MPQYDAEFIERIVQEVIRRLTGAGISVATKQDSEKKTELVLSDRLVTMATLQGRLDGIGSLVVNRKSLLTPAVRDELNRRNIQLRKE